MSFQRVHNSQFQQSQSSANTSPFAPRPFPEKEALRPPTQEEIENQAFHQDKFEATGLQLKEKYGSITPFEQERLGMLQAKMDSFWTQRRERTETQPNLLEILSRNAQTTQATEPVATVQPKLKIGQPNDQYEQEADQVAFQVMNLASPRTPNIQHQAEKSKNDQLIQANDLAIARRMVVPVIQRQAAATTQPPSTTPTTTAQALPSADELTTRLARCIGIWETNRGKDNPAPKESSLDTVAGVHASMATIEQATMPYAITALKKHKQLRDQATPPLTLKELNDADARCAAVVTLLASVTSASARGETPDDFIKNKTKAILATGLSNDDVKTMFSAVTLKSTLGTAHSNAEAAAKSAKAEAIKGKKTPKQQAAAQKAARQKSVNEAIDAIPAADRLGLGEGSLKAYINKPGNWGENRAAWQRKAVALMPNNIGSRIETIAVSDQGTALALPVIKTRVNAELAKKPVPSLENIVKTVAQKNNPGETNYGKHVWETYIRLYP